MKKIKSVNVSQSGVLSPGHVTGFLSCTHVKTIVDKRQEKFNFSGAFTVVDKGAAQSVHIKQVLYNDPVVVVWWSDGTQTRCKVRGCDKYSPETGLMYCIFKKISPDTSIDELYSDWLPEQLSIDGSSVYVNTKDVRQKRRAK